MAQALRAQQVQGNEMTILVLDYFISLTSLIALSSQNSRKAQIKIKF